MKNKKIYFLFGILFIVVFIVNTPLTRAIIKDQTISTIAEKDTYVSSYKPTSNYGGLDDAYAGSYHTYYTRNVKEAYFYFNFTDKPTDFTKAEISLDFWGVSETMNFTIYLINDDWSESSMDFAIH